ncbi:MAG: aldehyde ferredoxin oxidoreductase family protein [Desulfatibacillaceae bacterium]
MDKIIRINTRDRTHRVENLSDMGFLGGRALTSRIIAKEVPPDAHPLSSANKLVFAPGLLCGTTAPNSGRISVGGKSPLTHGIKESNAGGTVALALARLGIAAVVLEDKPDEDADWCALRISADGVEFHDAGELAGKTTYNCVEPVHKAFGEKNAWAVIGPGGETCRQASTIQFTDPSGRPTRSAGRGGLGAVMGSKKVKALVVDPSGGERVKAEDVDAFKTSTKRWAAMLKEHPVTSGGLPSYGTAVLINIINEAGALPTKNFRDGRFDKAPNISGEKMAEIIEKRGGKTREGCHPGCVIQCSQMYMDEKGEYLTSGFEYETLWALGANTTIDNLDDLAVMDRTCDEFGLDTIEMGNTLAVAMEAGIIPWGDGKAAIGLLRRVGDPSDPLGRIVGNGARFLGDAYGIDRVAVVKNQSLPAYDPRSTKGIGVTYCTSTQGADHTAGYAICQNVLNVGGHVDPLSKEGQVELSKNLQVATASIDSCGFCLFVAFAVLDNEDGVQTMADLVGARFGRSFSSDDFVALGVSTLKDEQDFNERAGFTKAHDQLPRFFSTEPLPPHNTTWDFTAEEMQGAKV